jgi:hypothetical protein
LIKFKNYEFSVNFVEKTMRQISDIQFRCALITILMASISTDKLKLDQKVEYLIMALNFFQKSKKKELVGK